MDEDQLHVAFKLSFNQSELDVIKGYYDSVLNFFL